MPAVSQKQQEFFGMVAAGKAAKPKGMTMKQVKDFARTPRKGLPLRAAAHMAASMSASRKGHAVRAHRSVQSRAAGRQKGKH